MRCDGALNKKKVADRDYRENAEKTEHVVGEVLPLFYLFTYRDCLDESHDRSTTHVRIVQRERTNF
jgi:hypothetical protein